MFSSNFSDPCFERLFSLIRLNPEHFKKLLTNSKCKCVPPRRHMQG